MEKRILTIGLLMTLAASVLAQPEFVPEIPSVKTRDIVWQNPKTVLFAFSNKGTEPLQITEVHPSCGCIKVTYPEAPIPAGQGGVIAATYDAGMLGTFYRELAVYTNARQQPYYLSFQGRVVETQLNYESDFPIDLGNVRLDRNYLEFADVNKGDRPVTELQVVNMEHTPYTPQLMHLPNYLSVEYLPTEVQPGRVGKIRLTLDSDRLFMDGLNQTSLYLSRYMGDKIGDRNEIVVSAVLLPAFRNLTAEEMKRAPRIVLMDGEELIEGETTFTMGGKKKVTKVLTVTNIGEETLTISNVQVFNRAMSVSLGDRNIKPHATAKLKITLDAKVLAKAKNGPRLLLICNDPRHAKTELYINVKP